jgi:uncharacterized protein YcbX
MKVESIWIYPVKGMKGRAVSSAIVEPRGFRFDRRWMLVDAGGTFLSQRKIPMMAILAAKVEKSCLIVSAPGAPDLGVDLFGTGPARIVTIWRSEVEANTYDASVDRWFSERLGFPCSLVRMSDSTLRATNPDYSLPGDHVSFADGYPITLATTSSLQDLNARLPEAIGMDRFRPNIVASGVAEPWIEETWKRVRIGSLEYRVAKPCGRCQVTTIDQERGTPTGDEPLRTLATFRPRTPAVNFSINLIPTRSGQIFQGDLISPF